MSRDPSRPTASTSSSRRLAIAFVGLVGLSGGTVAMWGGGSPAAIGGAVLVLLLVGGVLFWYLDRTFQQ